MKSQGRRLICGLIAALGHWKLAVADTATPVQVDVFKPKPLDGVIINAVETFVNPRPNQLQLSLGLYPLSPYATGLGLIGAYSYRFTQNYKWEIINASYVYSFDKGLTSQLANDYKVNPQQIEMTNFIVTSNVGYIHTHGKFVFLSDYIRNFESSVILGAGLVNTNLRSSIALNFGIVFEVFLSPSFTGKLDLRDALSISSLTNYVVLSIGMGYNF